MYFISFLQNNAVKYSHTTVPYFIRLKKEQHIEHTYPFLDIDTDNSQHSQSVSYILSLFSSSRKCQSLHKILLTLDRLRSLPLTVPIFFSICQHLYRHTLMSVFLYFRNKVMTDLLQGVYFCLQIIFYRLGQIEQFLHLEMIFLSHRFFNVL